MGSGCGLQVRDQVNVQGDMTVALIPSGPLAVLMVDDVRHQPVNLDDCATAVGAI